MSDEKPHSLRVALRRTNGVAFLFSTTTALFLLLPVYLQQTGSSAAQIGLVAGLMRVSMLIARPVAGRLLDRFGRRPVIAAGGIVAIAAILSIFLFPAVAFAADTEDALASGCLGAALGLVEHSRADAVAHVGVRPRLVVHGGGAEELAAHLPDTTQSESLVLDGLALWAGAEQAL